MMLLSTFSPFTCRSCSKNPLRIGEAQIKVKEKLVDRHVHQCTHRICKSSVVKSAQGIDATTFAKPEVRNQGCEPFAVLFRAVSPMCYFEIGVGTFRELGQC